MRAGEDTFPSGYVDELKRKLSIMSLQQFKRKKDSQPFLPVDTLDKLNVLFKEKRWPIEEGLEWSVFERYCRTLLQLNTNQQQFLIKLSYNFLHIPQKDYLSNLLVPLRKLRRDMGNKRIVFAACLTEDEVSCAKSALPVLYQIKGTTIRQHINLNPYVVVENIQKLGSYYNDKSVIVLVDDFIGSGETATKAIGYVHKLCPDMKDNSQLVVLGIVAMQQGVDALTSVGVLTYSAVVRKRGISEELPDSEIATSTAMMKEIEKNMTKLNDKFRFGYNQSEALVCMERCPNNTFPIYWLPKRDAPYER